MEEFWAMLILAAVQGITEWLPISSSGHLVLVELLLDYAASLEFEVALHFGTLMALFVYFGKDISVILEDILKGKWNTENARLAGLIAISTIPAILAGYFFYDFFASTFEELTNVMWGFAITAVVMMIASLNLRSMRDHIRVSDALLIGVAQAIAILPSISRSGATIAVALLLGLRERTALRFSFLMAIPALFGAGVLALNKGPLPTTYLLPTLVSFVTALGVMHLLLRYVLRKKANLRWFALYSLILSLGMAFYLYA